MNAKIGNTKIGRLAVLPLAAMMMASVAVGCKSDKDDTAATPSASNSSTPNAAAPAAPSGPTATAPTSRTAATHSPLEATVKNAIVKDAKIGKNNVDVTVNPDGVAVLTGSVQTDAAKAAAEKDAKTIKGIARVNNQLTVTP